ncbi:hypothetical protein [Sphingosinicella sp. CPCC 101087]|uniref:hypothetical protein n=1 Tax=Sphingosinicella sp. CPCC 101087 TaxID=2497754 RepID=UPI00101D410D|nr:hypothetical protein [Sphingosinicella sp. CPCC 101087]
MADRKRPAATSLLEWLMAAVGALVALGLLGFIGWEAATGANEGPSVLVAQTERLVPAGDGFVAEVGVRNLSDSTAAAVQVEGALKQGDVAVETSRATIDYIPGRGDRKIGLLFTRDPATFPLEVRVTGYQEP